MKKMKLAIMQPYFIPYIGYFQLINSVDTFVVYDNIQFSKRGWFHRNRILVNGNDKMISLPLKKDSDYLDVNQRRLADSFETEKLKLMAQIKNAYQKAPQFTTIMPMVEDCFLQDSRNLFRFVFYSIRKITDVLEIKTNLICSSDIRIDHALKGQDKVLGICDNLSATQYINSIGGQDLYDKTTFEKNGTQLSFLQPDDIIYPQFQNAFVPWLSIVDVLMFNSIDEVKRLLDSYTLL